MRVARRARTPRQFARAVGGAAKWATGTVPVPVSDEHELERTVCAVGAALHLQRTVPSLFAHGLAVEALAVTPPTGTEHIGSSLALRSFGRTGSSLSCLGLGRGAPAVWPFLLLLFEQFECTADFDNVLSR